MSPKTDWRYEMSPKTKELDTTGDIRTDVKGQKARFYRFQWKSLNKYKANGVPCRVTKAQRRSK